MTKLTDNIKAGVKGVHGAGEVIRGEALDAADQLFDNNHHPATIHNESKNQAIAEKGRQDIRNADATFAAREWERKDPTHSTSSTHVRSEAPGTAPVSANAPANTATAGSAPPPPARNVENAAPGAGYEGRTDATGMTSSEMGSSATGARY